MKNYVISDPRPYEGDKGSYAKNVVLTANSKKVSGLGKSLERTTDSTTLGGLDDNVINECYIDLSLDKLRKLDNDMYARQSFMRSRLRFLGSANLRIFVIKLRIESGQRLEDPDYGYLLSLLDWKYNDLPLMPVLEFAETFETPDQIRIYDEFVRTMISRRNSYSRLDDMAMSIPIFFPRRRLGDLFDLYGDIGPTFVAMDLDNKRVDSIPDGRYDAVLGHFREQKEERTFLYGMNVKPCKDGKENASALDVQSLHWSFNAVGPTHYRFIRKLVISDSWETAGRIYDPGSIGYIPIDEGHLQGFQDWVDDRYGFRFDEDYSKNVRSTYPYIQRYNFAKANQELMEISESLKRGETEMVDEAYDLLPAGARKMAGAGVS
jgi:hypothetical protein